MPKATPDERFDSMYTTDPDTGCWLWQRYVDPQGYGRFWWNGANIGAHVYAYQRKHGPVPAELVVDHYICNTKRCCNPDHLRPEDLVVNWHRDPKWNGNWTHCPTRP